MTTSSQGCNSKGRRARVDPSFRRVALLAIGIVFWISACSQTEEREAIVPPAGEAIVQPEGTTTEKFAGKIPPQMKEYQTLTRPSLKSEVFTNAEILQPASSWYWNAWADDSTSEDPVFQPVSHLEPAHTYRATVDLAGFSYKLTGHAAAERVVGETLKKTIIDSIDKGLTSLTFIPILLVDSPQIETRSQTLPKFKVDLKLVKAFMDRDPKNDPQDSADPLSYLRTHGGDAYFTFGRIKPFEIKTSMTRGTTAIGIALWSVERGRPIDELSIPLCVEDDEGKCGKEAGKVISLGSGSVMDLAADKGHESPVPDATLHIVQLRKSIFSIFARNDNGNIAKSEDFAVWRASDNAQEFVQRLQQHQDEFGSGGENRITAAKGITNLLFPDQDDSNLARKRFVAFVANARAGAKPFDQHAPRRLFVRMILPSLPEPTLYPVGLLATGDQDDSLVGYYVRIEMPLSLQHYASSSECVTNWKLLLPLRPNNDPALKSALDAIHARITGTPQAESPVDYAIGDEKFPIFPDMRHFLQWIDPAKGPGGSRPPDAEPTLLAVLSHYDQNKVFFDSDGFASADNVRIHFSAPSAAVLGTCASAKVGASGFVEALNNSNVDAVIATNSLIEGGLAGDFMDCLSEEYKTNAANSPIAFGDLFFDAERCLYNRNSAYGSSVLSFSLAGNPQLKLCAVKQRP